MGLTSRDEKKELIDPEGNKVVLHQLQECQYLKTNQSNHLYFRYLQNDDGTKDIEIRVEDAYEAETE